MLNEKPRYINPLTDFGFKKIFGNIEIMTEFLNDVIQPQSPIVNIESINKEINPDNIELENVIYDMLCRSADGSEFIVEMQKQEHACFCDRVVYYMARSISNQRKRGDSKWKDGLRPVYSIFILNFHLAGFQPNTQRTIQLKVEETGEIFSDKLKIFTLELPDYKNKPIDECTSKIDKWLYILKNMETMTTPLPFQQLNKVFHKIEDVAEYYNLTSEEQERYDRYYDMYLCNQSAIELACSRSEEKGREEGIEKGIKEGIEKGKRNNQIFTAKQLIQFGLTTEQIATATGLTIEEVEELL